MVDRALGRRVFLLSLAVSLAVATLVWFGRPGAGDEPEPTVLIRDHAADFEGLLRERQDSDFLADRPPGFLYEPEDKALLLDFLEARRQAGGAENRSGFVSDPVTFNWRAPNFERWGTLSDGEETPWAIRTNDRGFRNDADVRVLKPDLRILVTGDSHVDGVCNNDDTFAARLEASLARRGEDVEVLNGALGGFNPFHYLWVLERFADELDPDVFVVTIFGGNDFKMTLRFQRFFHRRPPLPPGRHRIEDLKAEKVRLMGARAQELNQLVYFLDHPDEIEVATETLIAITDRILERCAEHDVRPVFVWLPSPLQGQPRFHRQLIDGLVRVFGLDDAMLGHLDRIADPWFEHLAERDVEALDLRPLFRASDELLYWENDRHLNIVGHELVATALEPVILEALDR